MKTPLQYLNCTKEVINTFYLANQVANQHKTSKLTLKQLYFVLLQTPTIKLLIDIYMPHINTYIQDNLPLHTIQTSKLTYIPLEYSIIYILISLNKQKKIFNTFDLLKAILEYSIQNNINNLNILYSVEILKLINKLLISKLYKTKTIYDSLLNLLATNITYLQIDISSYLKKEKELFQLIKILNKKTQNNPILIGDPGSGKKTIIKSLLATIKTSNKQFTDIWIFNPHILCEPQEKIEVLFKGLLKLKINTQHLLLIIPDIHNLFKNVSEQNETESQLKHIFRLLLNRKDIQILGTTTKTYSEKLNNMFKDYFLFEYITVTNFDKPQCFEILKIYQKKIEKELNLTIKKEVLSEVYTLANKYLYIPVPKKYIQLLENTIYTNKEKKYITNEDVQKTLASLVNIPSEFIVNKTKLTENILNIESNLRKKVLGQENIISQIANVIQKTNLGLKTENKPLGSWLFCGFSGTGKTELAKSLTNCLFNSTSNMLRFDMSEFMEKHSVARMIGSPPGYVGYGEGGQLTEAIKKNPYSLILFDEIEKAHPDITNILLQVLDDGRLTDSTGTVISFTNTLIIFTSNLGCPKTSNDFPSFKLGTEFTEKEYETLTKKVNNAVRTFFKPEFLNRLNDILVFKPLDRNKLSLIFKKFLFEIQTNINNKQIPIILDIHPNVIHLIATLAYQPLYGARPLKRLMDKFIEKPLSDILIFTNLVNTHIFSISFDKYTNKFQYTLKKINFANII